MQVPAASSFDAESFTAVVSSVTHARLSYAPKNARHWLTKLGTETLNIGPGGSWENRYCEIFNGKLRDECLNGETFCSLKVAQVVIEQWRVERNTRRPHSALGYRPSVPAIYRPLVPANQISQPQAVM